MTIQQLTMAAILLTCWAVGFAEAQGLNLNRRGSPTASQRGTNSRDRTQQGLGGSQSGFGQQPRIGGQQPEPRNRGRQEQRGFIGSAQDMRDSFRKLSGGKRRRMMFDMMVENLNEMRDSRRQRQSQRSQAPPVRVQLRPAFEYPHPSPEQVIQDMQSRLTTVLQRRDVEGLQVTLEGRTATLRGVVHSKHERKLAERLIAIEPGVSRVENLLSVVPAQ